MTKKYPVLFFLVFVIVASITSSMLIFKDETQVSPVTNTSSVSKITEGDTLTIDGTRLHWWKYDRGTELVTVMLNGGPAVDSSWMREGYGNQLADVFGTIIFYDRRGCGLSDQEKAQAVDMTFEKATEDLMAILQDTVPNSSPIILASHSFGSTLAVHVASHLGERLKGVVFSGPFFDMDAEIKGRKEIDEECIALNTVMSEKQITCSDQVDLGWNNNEHFLQNSHLPSLKEIKVPVLMFTGQCDILANKAVVNAVKGVAPEVEIHVLPLEGHRAMFLQLESIKPTIQNFINRAMK